MSKRETQSKNKPLPLYPSHIFPDPRYLLKRLVEDFWVAVDSDADDEKDDIEKKFIDELQHHPECLGAVHCFYFQMNFEVVQKLVARQEESLSYAHNRMFFLSEVVSEYVLKREAQKRVEPEDDDEDEPPLRRARIARRVA